MAARGKKSSSYQGSKWITRERRLAIYLRDGLACAYCRQGIEDNALLTLDHIIPYSQTATPNNTSGNLVTACRRCNSSRGERSLFDFTSAVAAYLNHGVTGEQILTHVRACLARDIDLQEAKNLIARRGGFTAALSNVPRET